MSGHRRAWVVRISFSFADPTAVGLLSVIPQQSSPGLRNVNNLVDAVRRNLSECRRLWWLYQQNNPQLRTEGARCLNNMRYGGKTVVDATYDPGIRTTRLQFAGGTTMILPM